MYVSRLVYMVCLLEAVLWFQPNFALSNQRDMTKLLQTQTLKLNELAQNAVCPFPTLPHTTLFETTNPLSPTPPPDRSRTALHRFFFLVSNLTALPKNRPWSPVPTPS